MYQALYRKWRPLRFADVIGQQHVTEALRNQLKTGRLSHAYLFTGTRGTGKTTCAKILARAVNCLSPENGDPCNECAACRGILDGSVLDVVEIDAASNNGVENIRDIREETVYTPAAVRKRVYIIDEVHMLSIGAFNALLKTLEEPPSHVLFILATTDINKVPATIQSRCQRFDFHRIPPEEIAQRLQAIAVAEEIPLTESGAKLIARLADGAMRDALSLLDRAASEGQELTEEAIAASVGILSGAGATELMADIKAGSLAPAVEKIGESYLAGRDLTGVLEELLALIRDMLLMKTAKSDVSALLSPAYSAQTVRELCDGIASSSLIACSRIIQQSLQNMKNAANKRVETELCVIRLCSIGGEDYDTLGGRVEALEEKIKNGVPAAPRLSAPKPAADGSTDTASRQKLPDNAPPWDIESTAAPQPSAAVAPAKPKPRKAAAPPAVQMEVWPLWPKLLTALDGKVNIGVLTCIKLSARGVLENDNTLRILCDDGATYTMAAAQPIKEIITQETSKLMGKDCVLRVSEEGSLPSKAKDGGGSDALDGLLEQAREMDIPVTEES